MKKALKIIAIVILVLAIIIGGTAWYHGMFSKVAIETKNMGPYKMVYTEHKGSYYKVGETSDKLYNDMIEKGVESEIGIGIYFDDPAEVAQEDLRSEIGILVDTKPDSELISPYKYKEIDEQQAVVAEFPIKSPLSYMMAPAKVYPALEKYGQENNIEWKDKIGAIEIYDMPAKKIIYVMAVK